MSDANATASDQVVIDQVSLQRFNRFEDWVNYASSVLTDEDFGYPEQRAICFDGKGRQCWIGKDFMRARDDGSFPVLWVWPSQIGAYRLSLLARAEKAEADLQVATHQRDAESERALFAESQLGAREAQRDALAAALRSVQTDMRSDCIEDDDVMRMEKTITDALVGIPESPAGKQKDGPDPIEVEARRLYTNMMDNHPTIHSNRFGTWAELTESGRNVWRIRARESQARRQLDQD